MMARVTTSNGVHDPASRFVTLLETKGFDPRPTGHASWESRCPGHDGSRRNLSIDVGDDGKVLVCCHHEPPCSTEAIVEALGLTVGDLFPADGRRNGHANGNGHIGSNGKPKKSRQKKVHRTIEAAAETIARAKKAVRARTWIYLDLDQQSLMAVVRFDLPNGHKDYLPFHPEKGGWIAGDPKGKLPLFNLPDLVDATRVYLHEGEKAAVLTKKLGLPSTTTAHGAKSPQRTDFSPLVGKEVVILPDHDTEGEGYAHRIIQLLAKLDPRPSVKIVRLPLEGEGDDVAEWIEGVPDSWGPDECRDALEKMADLASVVTLDDFAESAEIAEEPPSGEVANEDDRVPIEISIQEYKTVSDCLDALAVDPSIYQRGHMLVMILRDSSSAKGITRPPGSPTISPLPKPRLREQLSRFGFWFQWMKKDEGKGKWKCPMPPVANIVNQVFDRREYPGIRSIEGIVEIPVLRPDGSILDRPGYDPMTGLVYEPSMEFGSIPLRPTKADAIEAAWLLRELVQDFPFADKANLPDGECGEHEAAWLSALLTPFARPALSGPAPLFLNDASTPGSGKTLLADLVAMIVLGRPMVRTALPDNDEEIRKRITSIALSGDQMILIDNVGHNASLGSPSLDAALTGTTWKDRILGRSEMTVELPLMVTWFATGNNVALAGDIPRRVIPSRLEPATGEPEKRDDFRIQEPLLDYAKRHRARFVSAALTILRAYRISGEKARIDGKDLPRFGSFESWSDVVRSAVVWTVGKDPLRTQGNLSDSSLEALSREALVVGWADLPGADTGLTVSEALNLVKSAPAVSYSILREALMEMSRNNELPSTKSVAKRLSALRGRVIGKLKIVSDCDPHTKVQSWKIVQV